jgi:hypothetical protein
LDNMKTFLDAGKVGGFIKKFEGTFAPKTGLF